MKNIFAIFLTAITVLSLAACGSPGSSAASAPETAEAAPEAEPEAPPRILVAYFSATGTTKSVAETMAEALSADLYEITPAQPYSDEDLNYNDSSSRSTTEQNDPACRPEISGTVENMADYDVVFLGYPIWWYEEPRILDTFAESYDFSGKTVVPFCTSGGSGIGDSGDHLEALTSGASWLKGQRFSQGVSAEEIRTWAADLGIGA